MHFIRIIGTTAALLLAPSLASAAAPFDGAGMSWVWALPFIGLLLSIASGPLFFPTVWHGHYGKIAAAWATLALIPTLAAFGVPALGAFVHAVLAEYLSFIVLLFALYTVAGGILVTGGLHGRPLVNTAILGFGTLIASVVGTTGAAMILIRPLLRANAGRKHVTHVAVFFIILVANVGGALSPLGDPPLFVGFLRGVDFFWPAQNLWLQTAIVASILLVVFLLVDAWQARRDTVEPAPEERQPLRVRGTINLLLIAMVIGAILLSSAWQGAKFDILGVELKSENVLRDVALLLIAGLSLWLTPDEHREANGFTWEPIREVAKLFAAIFVAVVPVLAMLAAGPRGAFAWLVSTVTAHNGEPNEAAYFWLTGVLSAFLDNAPTYLVFFQLAGGDASQLMGPLHGTLAAISMGAVYMGALTYIGNAPNFMIYAIAKEHGIRMPSFFGYLFWAALVLIPLFLLLTWLPIPPLLTTH